MGRGAAGISPRNPEWHRMLNSPRVQENALRLLLEHFGLCESLKARATAGRSINPSGFENATRAKSPVVAAARQKSARCFWQESACSGPCRRRWLGLPTRRASCQIRRCTILQRVNQVDRPPPGLPNGTAPDYGRRCVPTATPFVLAVVLPYRCAQHLLRRCFWRVLPPQSASRHTRPPIPAKRLWTALIPARRTVHLSVNSWVTFQLTTPVSAKDIVSEP